MVSSIAVYHVIGKVCIDICVMVLSAPVIMKLLLVVVSYLVFRLNLFFSFFVLYGIRTTIFQINRSDICYQYDKK